MCLDVVLGIYGHSVGHWQNFQVGFQFDLIELGLLIQCVSLAPSAGNTVKKGKNPLVNTGTAAFFQKQAAAPEVFRFFTVLPAGEASVSHCINLLMIM